MRFFTINGAYIECSNFDKFDSDIHNYYETEFPSALMNYNPSEPESGEYIVRAGWSVECQSVIVDGEPYVK